jgi:hypothetical protein
MAKDKGPWDEGRKAWERLNGWRQDDPAASLAALCDIGKIRTLLGQAELAAVRTARQHGKSWAEIATMLGITRQSAWERWRDLDDTPQAAEQALDSITEGMVEEAARSLRRKSKISVPNVVGMTWSAARDALMVKGLGAYGNDPDGLPLTAEGWPSRLVVTDQLPESGARVPLGTPVRLWVERGDGGSAGVREPRRPKPDPKAGVGLAS